MTVAYNEIEAYPAQWLRNLSDAGHIAEGKVDERSIEELQGEDIEGATQFHAFAGVGTWSYALRLAGWADDIPVWTGSCPCQPFSAAGKGLGELDPRHLWPEWLRLIRECAPPIIFGEQVASPAALLWYDKISSDLEELGYAVGAAALCSSLLGYQARRRLFFVAHSDRQGEPHGTVDEKMASIREAASLARVKWRDLRGVVPCSTRDTSKMGRLRAYGNAINPEIAAVFIRAFMEITGEA